MIESFDFRASTIVVCCVVFFALFLLIFCFLKLRRLKRNSFAPFKIGFLHPDLGIGGAEKFVVEAAVALQNKGHQVILYTAHHDPHHCFPATRDGTLRVVVFGDWLPNHIFHKFHLPCALLRFFYLSLRVIWTHRSSPLDLFFVDQISATIPLLKLTETKVLFYCHFPDQLLARSDTLLKKFYRLPLNYLEEITTGAADKIFVNSKFTAEVFRRTFRRIRQTPTVLYPAVDASSLINSNNLYKLFHITQHTVSYTLSHTHSLSDFLDNRSLKRIFNYRNPQRKYSEHGVMILSLNRFERKKNIKLALETVAYLKSIDPQVVQNIILVIAGGYDPRVKENVEHFQELKDLADRLNLNNCTRFITSPSDEERNQLFREAFCVLYTPQNEHFGIVPLEAAFASLPVIACNSGGPLETIEHEKTGFLCEPTAQSFGEALHKLLINPKLAQQMGTAARHRAQQLFSFDSFVDRLNNFILELCTQQITTHKKCNFNS